MDKAEIGKRIRELRHEKGLTQYDLSGILHLDRKIISRWENGISCPYATDIGNLAELFGVSCNYIITGKDVN